MKPICSYFRALTENVIRWTTTLQELFADMFHCYWVMACYKRPFLPISCFKFILQCTTLAFRRVTYEGRVSEAEGTRCGRDEKEIQGKCIKEGDKGTKGIKERRKRAKD